jgi:hypothetical protein
MKAIIWDEASQGMKFEYGEIPADLVDTAKNGVLTWLKLLLKLLKS